MLIPCGAQAYNPYNQQQQQHYQHHQQSPTLWQQPTQQTVSPRPAPPLQRCNVIYCQYPAFAEM